MNYLTSEMRIFGWDCPLFGVLYHHGRVHSAPTPIPENCRDSEIPLMRLAYIIPRLIYYRQTKVNTRSGWVFSTYDGICIGDLFVSLKTDWFYKCNFGKASFVKKTSGCRAVSPHHRHGVLACKFFYKSGFPSAEEFQKKEVNKRCQ